MKTLVKRFICSLIMLVAISGLVMQPAFASGLVDDYCEGKADGDYAHPTDCTKFISCSNEMSYEMNCPACNPISDGPERCPDGKLQFFKEVDRCEWANVANCQIDSSQQSSFFSAPFQTALMGSMPTTGVVGKRCSL